MSKYEVFYSNEYDFAALSKRLVFCSIVKI